MANMSVMVKKRIAVTVSDDILKWVDRKVKDTTFANRSHAIEHCLTKAKEAEEKSKDS
jgi:Arc/MetJ-type ribon-helix-helix transcriptional regulator